MEIIQAAKEDIPEIVNLLKVSLGENLVPKSEEYFVWKHEENPFGQSYINLAKEGGEIIGLRTFMRWHFQRNDEMVTAVRAVDTATHPSHQGKGIFRKLTMRAVDDCKSEGVGLVYNTPNNSSRPGYLKMGWKDAGRMPIMLRPGSLIPSVYSPQREMKLLQRFPISELCTEIESEIFPTPSSIYYSPLSHQYLCWRFRDCPVVKYGGIAQKGSFGIVFRIKPMRSFIELRVCEQWVTGANELSKLRAALRMLIRNIRPALVSAAPSPLAPGRLGFFGPFHKGPITTVRELNYQQISNFAGFKAWQPSIGAIELF